MLSDIYIERDVDGRIIRIGFSQTFYNIIKKHPSVLKDILKNIEIASHTEEEEDGRNN